MECDKYGIKTISYSFYNHIQKGKVKHVLSVQELNEGHQHVLKANKILQRNIAAQPQYVKNLLNRNWFQVKNSEAIFAIAKSFLSDKLVEGGTGWAVQMAIDEKKPVFVFDQKENCWKTFDYQLEKFVNLEGIPRLTSNFAGIGTRDINDNGKLAIIKILEFNLKNHKILDKTQK